MEKIFKESWLSKDQELLNRFESFFPQGKMTILNINDLPPAVLDFFESNSKKFVLPEVYQPKDFKKFMLVNFDNGDRTYIANQVKKYNEEEDGTEDLNYLVDYRGDENIGHAELRYNLSDSEYFQNKPFIGYTNTEEKYQKTGLGMRRIFLLDALAKTFYNHSVCSDTVITDQAKSLWEYLVQDGKAKKFKEGEHDRYMMLD